MSRNAGGLFGTGDLDELALYNPATPATIEDHFARRRGRAARRLASPPRPTRPHTGQPSTSTPARPATPTAPSPSTNGTSTATAPTRPTPAHADGPSPTRTAGYATRRPAGDRRPAGRRATTRTVTVRQPASHGVVRRHAEPGAPASRSRSTPAAPATPTAPSPSTSGTSTATAPTRPTPAPPPPTSHTYADRRRVTIGLRVTDDTGATAPRPRTLTVQAHRAPNQPPTASFTATPNPAHTAQVIFDAAGPQRPRRHHRQVRVGPRRQRHLRDRHRAVATASHTYDAAGDVTVGLRVTDDAGATDTTTARSVQASAAAAQPAPTAPSPAPPGADGQRGDLRRRRLRRPRRHHRQVRMGPRRQRQLRDRHRDRRDRRATPTLGRRHHRWVAGHRRRRRRRDADRRADGRGAARAGPGAGAARGRSAPVLAAAHLDGTGRHRRPRGQRAAGGRATGAGPVRADGDGFRRRHRRRARHLGAGPRRAAALHLGWLPVGRRAHVHRRARRRWARPDARRAAPARRGARLGPGRERTGRRGARRRPLRVRRRAPPADDEPPASGPRSRRGDRHGRPHRLREQRRGRRRGHGLGDDGIRAAVHPLARGDAHDLRRPGPARGPAGDRRAVRADPGSTRRCGAAAQS